MESPFGELAGATYAKKNTRRKHMMENPRIARGRNASRRGKAWAREAAKAIEEATGLEFPREIREQRDGNLGDIEIHPRIPHLYECKSTKEFRPWTSLKQAQEAAHRALREKGVYVEPCVVYRLSHGPGKPSERMAILPLRTFESLAVLLLNHKLLTRNIHQERLAGKAPNLRRALQMAKDRSIDRGGIPVGVGLASHPRPQVAVLELDDYLWVISQLVTHKVW